MLGLGACCFLCFRCRDPLSTFANHTGKPTMLSAHQALPILEYKLLKGLVKKSEFRAGQNLKQVAIEVSEDLMKVQISGAINLSRHHAFKHFSEGQRPVHQHSGCGDPDLSCATEIGRAHV